MIKVLVFKTSRFIGRRIILNSIISLQACSMAIANASPLPLPAELSDANTTVTFEVDSTWHLIEGTVKGISGTVTAKDLSDPYSISGRVVFPVRSFSTARESRDEKMREVLKSIDFPNVELTLLESIPTCGKLLLEEGTICDGSLIGDLQIRGVKKRITIPATFLHKSPFYGVEGSYPIVWAEYGVEDPSILVAKLNPIVRVKFAIQLPPLKEVSNK